MEKGFYAKKEKCPVCGNVFDNLKVAGTAVRVVKKDEDFCPYYEPINYLLYFPCLCSACGYAAMEDKFENISDKNINLIKEVITSRWVPREFNGERTINDGIELYKLVLLNLQVKKANSSEIASVCMRIAWLYRFINDPKEYDFLKFALSSYKEAFENENLPTENLDEITCMYIIGELSRRLEDDNEAGKWYHKVISYKNIDEANKGKTNYIINLAREQLQRVRDKKDQERKTAQ